MAISIARPVAVAEVVDALRELLERAEAGELRSLVYAGLADGGCVTHGYAPGEAGVIELIGTCAVLQRDLLEYVE